MEGPPKVYEEIMRSLEADIRKHIRIEHQLKLHIESVEDRVEEPEGEQGGYGAQPELSKGRSAERRVGEGSCRAGSIQCD